MTSFSMSGRLFLSMSGPPVFKMFHSVIIATEDSFLCNIFTFFGYKIILLTVLNKNIQKYIPKLNDIKINKFLEAGKN